MVLINKIEYAYTDGSVTNNGKSNARGGCGVFFGNNDPRNMAIRFRIPPVTTPRTELFAVYKALEIYIKSNWNIFHSSEKLSPRKKLYIYSDSLLTVETVQSWMDTWNRNGWHKKDGKHVQNVDLIQSIFNIKKYYIKKLQIKLIHIRSHQPAPKNIMSEEYMHWYGNEMADRLASMGRRSN
jgi:ribonuclease HI